MGWGHYLVLVVPGKLQGSLKKTINDTKPGLLAQCHECVLTLNDPIRKVCFPRTCVLVNLGTHEVVPAKLEPTVPMPTDSTTAVFVQAFQNKAPEEWAERCHSPASAMTHVLAKIAKILSRQAHTIERWGFVYRDEQTPWLTLCVRAKSDKANDLYNSKDSLCFFRKFFTRDQQATAEDNVAIIWSSCSAIAAMKHIADTLQGILGYAGNSSSIGVRVKKENIAAARHALMRPNPRITNSNRNVAGTKLFETAGWPPATSAQAVVATLATAVENKDKWVPWDVIPSRHFPRQDMCTWNVRADVAPLTNCIILADGLKLTIRELPNRAELKKARLEKQQLKNEKAKEDRNQRIIAQSNSPHDPWISAQNDPWQQTTYPTKGKGKEKTTTKSKSAQPAQAASSHSNQSSETISQLQEQVDALNRRVNAQDDRLQNLEDKMTTNHGELMNVVRAIASGSTDETSTGPRPSK